MTLLLAALALVPPAAASDDGPTPIRDFEGLIAALTGGEEVRAVIRYGQCLIQSAPGPDVIAGMPLSVFEVFPKLSIGNPVGFVSTSHSRRMVHPRYGQVVQDTRLNVFEDGRAEVSTRYLDPRKHKVLTDETFGCAFAEQGGITLFGDG